MAESETLLTALAPPTGRDVSCGFHLCVEGRVLRSCFLTHFLELDFFLLKIGVDCLAVSFVIGDRAVNLI
jgi:hypothetical protein